MKVNYFNFRKHKNGYLITNDFGAFAFIDDSTFNNLLSKNVRDERIVKELKEKGFIYSNEEEFLQGFRNRLRQMKRCLFTSTSLFIIVVTTECNGDCLYCQAKGCETKFSRMNYEVADKAIDLIMSSPAEQINIEFQGGEPLLNFELVKYIVENVETKCLYCKKDIKFSLVSNLVLINDEIASFLKNHKMGISSSLDGNQPLHDTNRPLKNGKSMYEATVNGYKFLSKSEQTVGFIQTTTKHSLGKVEEIVNEYFNLKTKYLFIRPLTPVGMAKDRWEEIGYTPEDFVDFYSKCLDSIIEKNLKGYPLKEGHAVLFLEKILNGNDTNYMELRSPCGASLGQMAIYPNGDVYTCDEGRMVHELGSELFRLGNVNSSYETLTQSSACRSTSVSSIIESLPECNSCVYSPYCGVCPVVNYVLYGDLISNSSRNYKCKINMGMLNKIFSILISGSEEEKEVLYRWVNYEKNI